MLPGMPILGWALKRPGGPISRRRCARARVFLGQTLLPANPIRRKGSASYQRSHWAHEARCHGLGSIAYRYVGGRLRAAFDQLHHSAGQFLAYGNAEGHADQVRILKLHAGAFVAVIEQGMLRLPANAWSARMVIFVTPTGPSEPASAPNHWRISSGCAGRNAGSVTLAANRGSRAR